MAYITPNSDVYILHRVPLDKSYNHTIRQTNADSQFNKFNTNTYVKYRLGGQSYQRTNKGAIRVAILADNLYDCNYLMFRNTSFGSKWFYAFIDSIDYINDNASEINYTIDVMQTWYFDYDLGDCYVEREHTSTDNLGDNLVPEDLHTGDLIPFDTTTYYFPTNANQPLFTLLVYYVPNDQYISGENVGTGGRVTNYLTSPVIDPNTHEDHRGIFLNGVYLGCQVWSVVIDYNDLSITRANINLLIQKIISISGTITNLVQVPTIVYTNWVISGTMFSANKTIYENPYFYNAKHTSYYTPKNKKLYTYPYRALIFSNNNGDSGVLHWERFNNPVVSPNPATASFKINGTPAPTPELLCYPTYYRGLNNDYESGLTLTDFPAPPWSVDSFERWWAQSGTSYIMSMIASSIATIAGIAAAGVSGGSSLTIAAAGVSKITNDIGKYITAKNTPDQSAGQAAISSLKISQQRIGYIFYDMGVEKSQAKVIDDYFTMFGYAIHQVKKPNIKSGATLRPHWNYIKTTDCVIHAASDKGLPAHDEDLITKIFDKGITFWNNMSEVGDYSLNNSPS